MIKKLLRILLSINTILFFTNGLLAQNNCLGNVKRMLKTPQVFEQKLVAALPFPSYYTSNKYNYFNGGKYLKVCK